MNILFEVVHPAQVHKFRNAILALQHRGHRLAVAARDKDVLLELLDEFGIGYTSLSKAGQGTWALGRELAVRDWRMWRLARQFKPHLGLCYPGASVAHVGFLLRFPGIAFEDTEHAGLQQRITLPFATRICTTACYEKDWGTRQIRCRSLPQLAYLHPSHFTPDPAVLAEAGLQEQEPFIIVRLVSWAAAHDTGQSGIPPAQCLSIIERLEQYGRVFLTSEAVLPELRQYRLPVPPAKFHHLLARARLCFGEGGSVAAEAAVLGIPAVYVNTLHCGYLRRLENHYQLIVRETDPARALQVAEDLLNDPATTARWQQRRRELLEQELCFSDWMVDQVEDFCKGGDT